MNGRSRAEAALMLEEPDRLPIGDFGITPPVTSKIIGRVPYYRNTPICWDAISDGKVDYVNQMIAKDRLDLARKLKTEWIRVYPNAYPRRTKIEKAGSNMWRVNGVLRRWVPQTNMDWAINERPTPPDEAIIDSLKESIIAGPKPEEIAEQVVDDSFLYPIKLLSREIGGQALIFGDADGTFPLHDVTRLLKWMYIYPDFVKEYTRHQVDVAIELGRRQIEAGADGIVNGSDYAYKNGPFMAPKLFEKFIFPELKRETQSFKKLGSFVVLHSDGDIRPLLKYIVDAGVDGVHPLDPVSGVDIGEIKERYGDKICLVGNIDLRTLNFGTKSNVVDETLECIRKASYAGGHILATANVVDVGVKFDNFMIMMKVAKRYGKYPL